MSIQSEMVGTHRQIDAANRALAIAEDELASLKRELAALRNAEGSVRGDRHTFLRQLAEKRTMASRVGTATTARCARDYAAIMGNALGSSFERGVSSEFDGFLGQIRKAIGDVESEIRQKEAQIGSLRSELRRLFAQLDAQERAAAEERARENG